MSRLRFDRPAADWLEALPLGDGFLGAMCFGAPERPRFQLNHVTGWSGGPVPAGGAPWTAGLDRPALLGRLRAALARGDHAEAERLARLFQDGDTATFLPLGELVLVGGAGGGASDRAADYERVLDLATATHTVRGGGLVHETIVSAADGVLVHRVTGPTALRRGLRPELASPLRELRRERGGDGELLVVRFPSRARDGVFEWADAVPSVSAAVAVRIEHGAQESVLVLAVATDYVDALTPPHGRVGELARAASVRVESALARGWGALRTAHARAHGELWGRTVLELGGAVASATALEAIRRGDPAELVRLQFDYGRYLLICSARPGGLPPTLQGLWNAQAAPPWRSNYTINVNTEMNHWAVALARLPECAAPLLALLERLAVTGAEAARRLYGAHGWVAHHNTDAWAYAGQAGEGADSPSWAFWPFGGVWLTLTACELLDFGLLSADERARLAAVVAGCAEFVLDWLTDAAGPGLTTVPSTSPENEFALPGGGRGALSGGSTMDLTLARALLERFLALNDPRGRHFVAPNAVVRPQSDDLAARAEAALGRLPTRLPLTGEGEGEGSGDGEVREWGGDERAADPHHRHVSQLVGVYPGALALDDAERAAVASTLERRGDDSTGWSLIWKACLWARLGRGDRVGELLALARRPADDAGGAAWRGGLYPNLFAAHPPFQIDANLAFPAALAESLVQSHRGVVELLPALPPELPDGRVRGLLARPGVLVDVAWAGGRLVEATLRLLESAADSAGGVTLDVSWAGRRVSATIPSAVSAAPVRLPAAAFGEHG